MADAPIGLAASIFTLIQLTQTVVEYIKVIKEANNERQNLLNEIVGTQSLLVNLENKAKAIEFVNTFKLLARQNGPLDQFKVVLSTLASRLQPSENRIQRAGRAVVWCFTKKEIDNVITTIERQKSLFTLALQNDHL